MTVARFPVSGGLRSDSGNTALAPYVLTSSSLSQAYVSGTILQLGRALTIKPNMYIGVDVGTVNCEIATVQSVNGGTITLTAALLLPHPAGAVVQAVPGSEVPAWWFGIVSDGVTDDTAGWLQATAAHTGQNRSLWVNGAGNLGSRPSMISSPVVRCDSTRLRQVTFLASASFTSPDANNAMLMSQNNAPNPNILTFTASAGTVTTPVAHGLQAQNQLMFKNTNGTIAGAIENRSYYAVNTTTTTFQLASTITLASQGTSDVTITAGAGTVYLGLSQEGRQFYDDVYLNTKHVPGVNGIIDALQQPGFAHKLRVDNAVAVWGTLIAGASSFTGANVYYMVVGVDSAGNLWRTGEVQMTPDNAHQVVLTWGNMNGVVPGNVTWRVYRVSNSGTEQTVTSLVASGLTGNTFTDTGAAPSAGTCPFLQFFPLVSTALLTAASGFNGSAQFWRVAAVDASGNILASNELTASPDNAHTVRLTWNPYPAAVTYNVYRSSTSNGQATSPALVTSGIAATSSLAPMTFTDTGTAVTAGSCPLPANLHPSGFGLYVNAAQYVWINFESIACDTGCKFGAGELLWFFGFDVEQCALRAVHSVPQSQHIMDLLGGGILNAVFLGVHHEMPTTNYVTTYDLEGPCNGLTIGPSSYWLAGGQHGGVGGTRGSSFIWQHQNNGLASAGYSIYSLTLNAPSVPGCLVVNDSDRSLYLDGWTDYHQTGPKELIVPESTSSSTFSQIPVGFFGPNGRRLTMGSQGISDPSFYSRPGTAQTAPQFVTNDTNGNPTVQVLASGQLQFASSTFEATGAGSAALGANCPAVTVTAPFKWLKVQSSDGSTVFIPCWK